MGIAELNWLAILLATISGFVIGFLLVVVFTLMGAILGAWQ